MYKYNIYLYNIYICIFVSMEKKYQQVTLLLRKPVYQNSYRKPPNGDKTLKSGGWGSQYFPTCDNNMAKALSAKR